MNKEILNTGAQSFINKYLNADIVSVLLRKRLFPGISNQELAQQVEAKKKCKKKLPSWFNSKQIYYPNKLNIEQCSSETTARYKATIVHGKSLVDLTGGLGVDSFFFSKKIDRVTHCEIDPKLSEIAAHNFNVLGAKNIDPIHASGIEFLEGSNQNFDWAYLDPSRRNDLKEKVFLLSDYTPDPTNILALLLSKSKNILLKTSPLLDVTKGIEELRHVHEIHIVAIKNEVKELLWVLNGKERSETKIHTINIKADNSDVFSFNRSDEPKAISTIGPPAAFLYEPNAALLKSGAFKLVSEKFGLVKLHEHTHLYSSNGHIDFPGRSFRIEKKHNYSRKLLKSLNLKKANIAVRNFPMSVAAIRKLSTIKDGGNDFLFFTQVKNQGKVILHCKKVQYAKIEYKLL